MYTRQAAGILFNNFAKLSSGPTCTDIVLQYPEKQPRAGRSEGERRDTRCAVRNETL